MKDLEKQFNQVNSVIESLKVALELCENSSLMMEGVVTKALSSATALHEMMLDSLGWSSVPASGPEAEDDGENDDFSWMDDMEAAGAAPV